MAELGLDLLRRQIGRDREAAASEIVQDDIKHLRIAINEDLARLVRLERWRGDEDVGVMCKLDKRSRLG